MPHLPALDALSLLKLATLPVLLVVLVYAEQRWPWRPKITGRALGNWGLALTNALLPLGLPLLSLLAASHWAEKHHFGLLHALAWPSALETLLAVLALDAAIYAQHRLMHQHPMLWALHRVHHSDPALDTSTGLRFHPGEALLSAAYKAAVVALLGASLLAATIFGLLLTAGSLFSHANLRLSPAWAQALRWLVVTPNMHRVHHSVIKAESDQNYGFFLPWWDHLFNSYLATPAAGEALVLGQQTQRSAHDQRWFALLCQPWVRQSPRAKSPTL